jgi:hypothetical protein
MVVTKMRHQSISGFSALQLQVGRFVSGQPRIVSTSPEIFSTAFPKSLTSRFALVGSEQLVARLQTMVRRFAVHGHRWSIICLPELLSGTGADGSLDPST